MSGIDPTKQLAREREYFRDTIRKDRQASAKMVEENENRHKQIQKNQLNEFIEDKTDIEKNFQENISGMKKHTQDAIEEKNNKFNRRLDQEREEFSKKTQDKSKDYDRRLNDITSSYEKAYDSEKERNMDVEDSQKKRYSDNVKNINTKTENRLKEYQERLVGAGASLKEQHLKEQGQLSRSHTDNLRDVYKSQGEKFNELKERVGEDIQKTKEVHENDMDHLKNHSRDKLQTMQKHYDQRYRDMTTDHSVRNDNLVELQRKESKKNNQDQEQQLLDARRDYNKEIRSIELEKLRRDNGNGDYAEVAKGQAGLNDKIVQENRIKHLHNTLVDTQENFNEKRAQDQDAFNQTLKAENTEASARLERKVNELNGEKIVNTSKERERARKQIENREYQNRLSKEEYERQLTFERQGASDKIQKLKENFTTSMKSLEEKGKADIEAVSKSSIDDKNEFMKKMHENRSNEVFAMRREFGVMMNGTVQDYEQRLALAERENMNLKTIMDNKVQTMKDQSNKELETQRTLFEDKRVADVRANQLLLDQRENTLKSDMNQMNVNYQKKMDKMLAAQERKLKLLTNDYENKLKELTTSKTRELAQKDITNQFEIERLKTTYEADKARIVGHYENVITAAKATHAEQMDQMKEYKRLS